MLKPKYLEQLPIPMIELYSQAEQDILADMARRISTYDYWIPAADWQYQKLIEMGNFHSFIMEALSARTGKSHAELERMMEEAGAKTLAFDTAIYEAHGLSPPPLAESEALRAVLADGLRKTSGLFDNLTATTADTATRQFEHALDRAWLQITSGGFDRNTAIRTAVKDLARDGVKAITYPSGHTDTIEVAVRRAIVTGVNQSALRLQNALADEMGCDLVETTAHSGARPSHAEWQGRVFSRSGRSKKYPSFVKATGYGTGDGLGGWNCRHGFFPYFEGSPRTYTQKDLDALEEKNVTYNGQKLTEYEASQQQRYIERQIRRWKRENAAMAAAGLDTTESAAKIHQWQETQKDFVRQTGLKRQGDREQVADFGRKEAAKASAIARKEIEKYSEIHYHKDGRIVVTDDWTSDEHASAPRKYKPNAVVDTISRGVQHDRTIYGPDAIIKQQIHGGNHGRPKLHQFGQHGEHVHDYSWHPDEHVPDRPARDATDAERIIHSDILGGDNDDN